MGLRGAFASCCGGFCGSKAFASCCGILDAFKGVPKTCHVAVSKPNRNSLRRLGRSHGKAGGTPSQAAAKAAAGI